MVEIALDSFSASPVHTVEINGSVVAVFKVDNEFFAIQNRCSHAEASLSEGEVYDCKVECPLHGAEFDLKTGEALTLPATKPVATYTTEVNENSVLVKEMKDA